MDSSGGPVALGGAVIVASEWPRKALLSVDEVDTAEVATRPAAGDATNYTFNFSQRSQREVEGPNGTMDFEQARQTLKQGLGIEHRNRVDMWWSILDHAGLAIVLAVGLFLFGRAVRNAMSIE
jgi:hypothetical protein